MFHTPHRTIAMSYYYTTMFSVKIKFPLCFFFRGGSFKQCMDMTSTKSRTNATLCSNVVFVNI